MFAALTGEESDVLRAHLTSGWYKQRAIGPVAPDGWWETAEIIKDIHVQRMAQMDAEDRARAGTRAEQAEAG